MKCRICGGSVSRYGNIYFKCDYCNQIYGINGQDVEAEEVYLYANECIEENSQEGYKKAIGLLEGIPQFVDSKAKVFECYDKIDNLKIEEEENRYKEEREQYYKNQQLQKKKRRMRIYFGILALSLVLVVSVTILYLKHRTYIKNTYELARAKYNEENYEEAIQLFQELNGYLDSNDYIINAETIIDKIDLTYNQAIEKYNEGLFEDACELFVQIRKNKDVEEYLDDIYMEYYDQADISYKLQNYDDAIELLDKIPDDANSYALAIKLRDSIDQDLIKNDYDKAIELYNSGEIEAAQDLFISVDEYEDAKDYLNSIGTAFMQKAVEEVEKENYEDAIFYLCKIDTQEKWENYEEVIAYEEEIKKMYYENVYVKAKNICKQEGYSAAEEYVHAAVNELMSNEESKDILKKIEPTQLISLEPYDKGTFIRCRTDYQDDWTGKISLLSDNMGKTYSSGIYCDLDPWNNLYIEYNIKEYSLFNTDIIMLEQNKTNDREAYIKIYGDGAILYTSGNITKGYITQYVSLDISNYSILKIEFVGTQYWNGCLADPILFQ